MRLRWQKFQTSNCTLAPTAIRSGSEVCRDLPTGKLVRGLSGILRDRDLDAAINLFAELFAFPGLPRLTGSWQTRVLRETPDNERRGNESVAG